MKNKSLYIIISIVLVAASGVAGFFIGRNTAAESGLTVPTAEVVDISMSDATVDGYSKKLQLGTLDTKAFSETFGINEELLPSLKDNPGDWYGYTIHVKVRNTTGSDYSFMNFIAKHNGKNDIYVDSSMYSMTGISDPGEGAVAVKVLVNNDMTFDQFKEKIKSVGLELNYCTSEESRLDESQITPKTIEVSFS